MMQLRQHARTSGSVSTSTGSAGIPAAAAHGLAGVVGQWWRARTQQPRQMRLVETLAIGPKRSVALLELDGQQFLVGMGADGVSTLLQIQHRDRTGEQAA